MPLFHLQVISPRRIEFEGEISSLTAPGGVGYLGVLSNHAPLLTTLQAGRLKFTEANGAGRHFRLEGNGFLEVHSNRATLLVQEITPL